METQSLISIIVLSWNHAIYIEQSLSSVIQQTYSNIEIIYLDNCSSDETFDLGLKVLESSGKQYKAKRFDKNIGIPKAINYALSGLCSGEFIGLHSGDDWLLLDNYERKMQYHLSNPQYKVVYSNGYAFYEDTQRSNLLCKDDYCKEGHIFKELLKVNFLFTQGILIKKEVYDKIGLYDEDYSIEDWLFSLKAAEDFEIGYIKDPLFYWRRHTASYSHGKISDKFYEDAILIISRYKKFPEYKIGLKWVAFDYIISKMTPLYSLQSWKYIIKFNYLIIPGIRKKSITNPLLNKIWKTLRIFK